MTLLTACGHGLHEHTVSKAYQPVLQAVSNSVVGVGVRHPSGWLVTGSGFVVGSRGEVLTAAHVVESAQRDVTLITEHSLPQEAQVACFSAEYDLALLAAPTTQHPVRPLKFSNRVQAGDTVWSLGSPDLSAMVLRKGVFIGRVPGGSGLYGRFGYPNALLSDLAIQQGESGAPMLDEQGSVLGVLLSREHLDSGTATTIAHAIPASDIQRFLDGCGVS